LSFNLFDKKIPKAIELLVIELLGQSKLNLKAKFGKFSAAKLLSESSFHDLTEPALLIACGIVQSCPVKPRHHVRVTSEAEAAVKLLHTLVGDEHYTPNG